MKYACPFCQSPTAKCPACGKRTPHGQSARCSCLAVLECVGCGGKVDGLGVLDPSGNRLPLEAC
jgi:hypothetical protein